VPDLPAYEGDPRLTRLETEVVSAGEADGRPFVVVADTLFYPEGGGQPADHGTVSGVRVLDVQKARTDTGVEIRHFLDGAAPAGRVTLELDWARRFDHMQQHTAQHLLTAVADARFGWHTVAFHLGAHVCDIELDTPSLVESEVEALEEAVAEEIRAARPVTVRRVTAEEYAALPARSRGLPEGHTGTIRLVEIAGIDLNTCGGTHCTSTAELEALKLLGTESVRGGTRLLFVAGGRLRRRHGAHHRRNAELRTLLGTSDEDLVATVEAKLRQLKEAQRAVRGLEEELALAEAERLVARGDAGAEGGTVVLTAHWPERDLPFLQRVARAATERAPDRVVFLTCGDGEEGAFLLGAGEAADLDVAALGRRVAEVLGGRGGGSGGIFQGKATRMSRRGDAAALLGAGD
jgi:alanyl-tRNA synthetase